MASPNKITKKEVRRNLRDLAIVVFGFGFLADPVSNLVNSIFFGAEMMPDAVGKSIVGIVGVAIVLYFT